MTLNPGAAGNSCRSHGESGREGGTSMVNHPFAGITLTRQLAQTLVFKGKLIVAVVVMISAPVILQDRVFAQSLGSVQGQVVDPSGAVIVGAKVMLRRGQIALTRKSDDRGMYGFSDVPPGSYTLVAEASGFARVVIESVVVVGREARTYNVSLKIAVQQQDVTVTDQGGGVGVDPGSNASATVIDGADLDALSDDPDELQNELQSLAGPEAGPNGGQIYIDGFSGGQIPPKSSIRQIRINQNPFSAEFDRIGYGRVEILTKPGSSKFSGHLMSQATDSAWNTGNPLVQEQPSYYAYLIQTDVNSPLTRNASFFFSLLDVNRQNQNIVNAVNPDNTSAVLRQALPNPTSLLSMAPRIDFQLGRNNTLSFRDSLYRSIATGNGAGQLNLATQVFNVTNLENAVQLSDTTIVSSKLLNEIHFQWRRIRNDQSPAVLTPTVIVQGAFTTGGSNAGAVQDHQDVFEFQDNATMIVGTHTMRFGTRLRSYRDANYSTSGANGKFLFASVDQFNLQKPVQYQQTVIANPLARAILFDGAVFYQDDWRAKANLTLSFGLRFESQNRIRDHGDWAPRLSVAWAPARNAGNHPRTVLRAGYGWFYNRFTVPTSFSSSSGAPYILQAIHDNAINQQSYVVNNPNFYDPSSSIPATVLMGAAASIPSFYSVDHHFHAALDMQGGVGIDRQLSKGLVLNVTYLFTRGLHQYLTNNITAPAFDRARYLVTGPLPSTYNYQFQSGGVYNQHQILVTTTERFRRLSIHASYTFDHATADTQGVTYVPSVASDPAFDYGRPTFAVTSRLSFLGTYAAPYGITFAPLLAAQSGTPYNLTVGSDLTGNNQFNARPTFGICGSPDVVSTSYGCLDTAPEGKGEKVIPYGIGVGPANVVMHLRVSKTIGIGPRMEQGTGTTDGRGGGNINTRGLSGGQPQLKLDASARHRYSLTFVGGALNLFNIVNYGTPNGTLSSPLFGKSQSLASGAFGSPTPGNRTLFVQGSFNF